MKDELEAQRMEGVPEGASELEGGDLEDNPLGALQETGTCLEPSAQSAGVQKLPNAFFLYACHTARAEHATCAFHYCKSSQRHSE